jgi:hypothetical protein
LEKADAQNPKISGNLRSEGDIDKSLVEKRSDTRQ